VPLKLLGGTKMKKMFIASAALAATISCASANEALYANMGLLEQGLSNIQKGYLYNSDILVENGVKTLVEASAKLSQDDMRSTLPKGANTTAVDNLTASMNKNIKVLQDAVEKHQTAKAVEAYSSVVRDCISCHIAIRDK
jgi:cytochrome c556